MDHGNVLGELVQEAEQRLIEQLRELKERENLPQEELARKLHVSWATVSRWLRGRTSPSRTSLIRIANLIGATESSPEQGPVARAYVDLPPDPFPFIGRARELAELLELWPTCRLLTLTGAGGVGKSRLAIELMRRAGEPILGYVSLDVVRDPALALSEIVASLGVRSGSAMAEADAIVKDLRSASGVLFLDTCERIVSSLRPLLREIIVQAPRVKVLATSQVRLGLGEEHTWPVAGLEVPAPPSGRRLSPATAEDHPPAVVTDAVEYFLSQASRSGRPLRHDHASLMSIAEICRRTEGIPLALGLIAALTRSRSPAEILQRWKEHSESSSNPAAEPKRHRTIRSAIEWSAALLTPHELDLIIRLTVFSGPALLDDIAAMESPAAYGDALRDVLRLTDLSWLEVTQDQERSSCYRMLAPLREWAENELDKSGRAESMHRRHAKHFRGVCRQAEADHFSAAEPSRWPSRLEITMGNINSALAWCAASDPELGAEIAVDLLGWWRLSGRLTEGQHWLQAMRNAGISEISSARTQSAAALLAMDRGAYAEVRRLARAALEILELRDDARWTGRALTALSSAAKYNGNMESALDYLEQARKRVQRNGDQYEIAVTLNNLGSLAADRNKLEDAERHYRMSLTIKQNIGNLRSIALTMANLADIVSRQGRFSESRGMLETAMAHAEQDNDKFLQEFLKINQGENLIRAGNGPASIALFREVLDYAVKSDVGRFRVLATYGLGRALCASGEHEGGIEKLRECQRLAHVMGDEIAYNDASKEITIEIAKQKKDIPFGLTARELDVMALLELGKSYKEIARQCNIKIATVKRHINTIYAKLDVHNKLDAAFKWRDHQEKSAEAQQPPQDLVVGA